MTRSGIILLVEDNADDVALTLRAFEKSNTPGRIVVARDGAQALEYLFATGAHAGLDSMLVPELVLLDPRGSGASDPIALDPLPTWEDEVDDLRTVLDAVGSERSAIFACNDAGPLAMIFAATHPDRMRALALANTTARFLVGRS